MKATTTWLTEVEKDRIADQAIGLLATAGIRMGRCASLPALMERGAVVDEASGIVRMPRDLVEWAIAQCPRSFVMAGRAEDDDVRLGEAEGFHFAPSGCVAKTLDHRSGERRASTLGDLRDCTALNDELSQLDVMWAQVSASDVPLEARELTEYFTLVTETSKHVTFVDCPSEVEPVLRLCEALAGDRERFRERPRISTVITANSPLEVDGRDVDVNAALATAGVPVNVYSMAIAGATSPVTLAGTVVQGLAEFLGIATALQVMAAAARLVFCFGSGVLDMRRTTFALGSLESGLMAAMATEVGHHLGLPTLSPGFSTDAKHAGVQAGYEKAMKAATVCAAGTDIVTGWGLVDSHNTMSLPQSVIDDEMAAMLRRLHTTVEVSDETLGAAAIIAAGPGGSFLGLKDTARRVRAGEHFLPSVSDRLSYEKWAETGVTEYDTACARVVELLAAHAGKAPYLDDDQLAEVAAICRVGDEAVARARRH